MAQLNFAYLSVGKAARPRGTPAGTCEGEVQVGARYSAPRWFARVYGLKSVIGVRHAILPAGRRESSGTRVLELLPYVQIQLLELIKIYKKYEKTSVSL